MGSEDGDKISPNVDVEVHDVTMPVPDKVIGPARELTRYRLELALTPWPRGGSRPAVGETIQG